MKTMTFRGVILEAKRRGLGSEYALDDMLDNLDADESDGGEGYVLFGNVIVNINDAWKDVQGAEVYTLEY